MIWIFYITTLIIGLWVYYKSSFAPHKVVIALSLIFLFVHNVHAGIAVLALTWITYIAQSVKSLAWLSIVVHLLAMIIGNYGLIDSTWYKLGLSYYAIQNIGILLYTIRKSPQEFTFDQLLFANVFFAKFISGPILTRKEIKELGADQSFHEEQIHLGLNRILFGCFKKLVIADNLTNLTNTVFQHPESEFKAFTILVATLLFTFEMYLNFSAYTDIALGIGKLFNIQLKENFKRPMRSFSISEYWRKTHISLIDWLTQNIFYYITYTFRKHPVQSTLIAILSTFALSGIWHGAAIGFLIWGILNALYLMIEFLFKRKGFLFTGVFKYLGWALTIILVSFANLFFKAGYWSNSMNFLKQIFNLDNWALDWSIDFIAIIGNGGYLEQQLNLAITFSFLFLFLLFEKKWEGYSRQNKPSIIYWVTILIFIFLFGNFNAGSEFIYMQF